LRLPCDCCLHHVGDPNDKGEPTFHVVETAEGDELLVTISPYRRAVATLRERE
jgi:hypothetical protein